MNINQKLIALSILRNGGEIAAEAGRKSAVLELLRHADLANNVIKIEALQRGVAAEIERLAAWEPSFFDAPEGYKPPSALLKAEDRQRKYNLEWHETRDAIKAIGDALEAEIDAQEPESVARWHEGRITA